MHTSVMGVRACIHERWLARVTVDILAGVRVYMGSWVLARPGTPSSRSVRVRVFGCVDATWVHACACARVSCACASMRAGSKKLAGAPACVLQRCVLALTASDDSRAVPSGEALTGDEGRVSGAAVAGEGCYLLFLRSMRTCKQAGALRARVLGVRGRAGA
jgi:hypothetical protein